MTRPPRSHAGKLPDGYRDWRLISVAREEGDLDDIRAVLGNDVAIKAYREGQRAVPGRHDHRPARLGFDRRRRTTRPSAAPSRSWPGHPKNGVQFMVKDSKKYASTGGWGYSQFDDGKPLTDAAMLQSCFDCHQAVKRPRLRLHPLPAP